MDAVRITDFTLVQEYEQRDKIHLQRQEAGVWNDYHTDIGTYLGEVRTAVFDWDMQNPGEIFTITCPVGKYIIPINVHYTYKPGAVFASALIQLTMQTPSGNWNFFAEFTHEGVGRGGIFSPTLGSGPFSNTYGDVNEDLLIVAGDTGIVASDQGTCRIVVQYVEVTPL